MSLPPGPAAPLAGAPFRSLHRARLQSGLCRLVGVLVLVVGESASGGEAPLEIPPDGAVVSEPASSTADVAAITAIPEPSNPAPLPGVFGQPTPKSLHDLREFEAHLVRLIDKVHGAAVALRVGRAHGTGVVVSPDGLVLTAGHVLGRPGQRVEVIFPDGETVVGIALGRNRGFDSGLVRLPAGRVWPAVEMLAAADEPTHVGDWCLALGHPGGYEASRPMVARLGRVIGLQKRFVQTDCELVGGDSGGPLFDMRGRVIAIHSRIGEETYFNFHVPVAIFRQEWERLVSGEDFQGHSGAMLGLSGVTADQGLRITQVFPGEPAARAGVRVGDVLILFQSQRVSSIDQLIELVGQSSPGDAVMLELLRNGEVLRIEVELGARRE